MTLHPGFCFLSTVSPQPTPPSLRTFLPSALPPLRPGAHSLPSCPHHTFWKSTCTVLSAPTFGCHLASVPATPGNCSRQDFCVLS